MIKILITLFMTLTLGMSSAFGLNNTRVNTNTNTTTTTNTTNEDKVTQGTTSSSMVGSKTSSNSKEEVKITEEFTPTPEENQEVFYKSDGNRIQGFAPTYENYSKYDVLRILGKPDYIIKDTQKIKTYLETKETDRIKKEIAKGKLTRSQGSAFRFLISDIIASTVFGATYEVYIYAGNVPAVVFKNDKAYYITPFTEYINFKGELPH